MQQEKILVVGGYVRDRLLNRVPSDVDYLVVGMTEERFMELYPEAKKKVGKTFPVFKFNGEDYGFARREISTGPGHSDYSVEFGPDVTIYEDLARRDLTINAIAMCPETGKYEGAMQSYTDLDSKVLRHLAAFDEDPLRVIRLARFAAKLPEFTIAPETLAFASSLSEKIKAEPAERIWAETARALTARKPSMFFRTLKEMNCLSYWFRELHNLIGVPAGPERYHPEEDAFEHAMEILDKVSLVTHKPTTRWAAVCHDLGKALTPRSEWPKHHNHDKRGAVATHILCKRLQTGNRFKTAARLATRQHMRAHRFCEMRPGKAVKLMQKLLKMPGGIGEFIHLTVADGTCIPAMLLMFAAAITMNNVKLPLHLQNRGPASGESLLNLRAMQYKRQKHQTVVDRAGDCTKCPMAGTINHIHKEELKWEVPKSIVSVEKPVQ